MQYRHITELINDELQSRPVEKSRGESRRMIAPHPDSFSRTHRVAIEMNSTVYSARCLPPLWCIFWTTNKSGKLLVRNFFHERRINNFKWDFFRSLLPSLFLIFTIFFHLCLNSVSSWINSFLWFEESYDYFSWFFKNFLEFLFDDKKKSILFVKNLSE